MCGIAGIRRFGDTPITVDQIRLLLIGNEPRGIQATGLAFQQADGSVQVYKDDEPAWKFVSDKGFLEFVEANLKQDTVSFLGHTRLATQGSPRKNANNHPMWKGKTALVHNGCISGDHREFTAEKWDRSAETDSDILRAALDEKGFTKEALTWMNRLSGSAAFAAVSTDFPGKLILARSGSPLELAATEDQLLWSSEKGPIHKALRPFKKRFGIYMRSAKKDVAWIPMNNNSAYIIGNQPTDGGALADGDWIEWHQEIRIAMSYREPTRNVHGDFFRSRARFYDDKKVDVIECPNPACKALIPLGPAQYINLKTWKCKQCKTHLG